MGRMWSRFFFWREDDLTANAEDGKRFRPSVEHSRGRLCHIKTRRIGVARDSPSPCPLPKGPKIEGKRADAETQRSAPTKLLNCPAPAAALKRGDVTSISLVHRGGTPPDIRFHPRRRYPNRCLAA